MPVLVALNQVSFRRPGIESILIPNAGTANAWMTSAPVVWTRITLLTGTTISLSTPSRRGSLSRAIESVATAPPTQQPAHTRVPDELHRPRRIEWRGGHT